MLRVNLALIRDLIRQPPGQVRGIQLAARRVALTAQVIAGGSAEERLEAIVAQLSLEPGVTRAGWSAVED